MTTRDQPLHDPHHHSPALPQLAAALAAEDENSLRARSIKRIRTIQGALAIEVNTLSEQQITAISAGQRVMARQKKALETCHAINAHEQFDYCRSASDKHRLPAPQA